MKYELVAYQPDHLMDLAGDTAEGLKLLEASREMPQDLSWTITADGKVIGCGGVIPFWEGRATCWAAVSLRSAPHMLAITRIVEQHLDHIQKALGYHRIEAAVLSGFRPAKQWVKLLGFQEEGLMRAYSPDRQDYRLYARIRG